MLKVILQTVLFLISRTDNFNLSLSYPKNTMFLTKYQIFIRYVLNEAYRILVGARCIRSLCLSLYIGSFSARASVNSSDEPTHLHKLIRAFAARIYAIRIKISKGKQHWLCIEYSYLHTFIIYSNKKVMPA